MKQVNKTFMLILVLCLVAMTIVAIVQLNGESQVSKGCSYLDPPIIDFLAFLAALFLIIEGLFRVVEHKDDNIKKQFTRVLRILLGCTILTLHIMQFLHKFIKFGLKVFNVGVNQYLIVL